MDLTDNAEEAEFRKEVQDFIAAEAPNRGSGLPARGEGMAQGMW